MESMGAMIQSGLSWRCWACGSKRASCGEDCARCGVSPREQDRATPRVRAIMAPSHVESFGNENVQNNVLNLYGDVCLPPSLDGDWDWPEAPVPARQERTGALQLACTVAMWVSAISIGIVAAFFAVVFIKAFLIKGL